MSVMLRTTNPTAAAEYEDAKDRRVPYLGQVLIYHARPGEGRSGKLQTLAFCSKILDEDHVELMIMWDQMDFNVGHKIARKSDQQPFASWSFNDWDMAHYKDAAALAREPTTPAPVSQVELDMLKARVETLDSQVAQLIVHAQQQAPRPPKASRKVPGEPD